MDFSHQQPLAGSEPKRAHLAEFHHRGLGRLRAETRFHPFDGGGGERDRRPDPKITRRTGTAVERITNVILVTQEPNLDGVAIHAAIARAPL